MIKLIKQPSFNTCTSACLAMITGLSVDQVVEEFHEKWFDKEIGKDSWNPITYLIGKGFRPIINVNPYDDRVLGGVVSLITVPSLNLEGKLHHILYDNTDPENKRLLDPSTKKTYDFESLSGWTLDLSVVAFDVPERI